MSQENKYPNYPAVHQPSVDYIRTTLADLIQFASDVGIVFTVELEHTELAMGHYRMVPHVRGARTLAHDKATNIDPLLLVPVVVNTPIKVLSDHSYHIDEIAQPDIRRWFEENGFSLVMFDQVIDAAYNLNLQPRAFDAFKRTQHAITLPA